MSAELVFGNAQKLQLQLQLQSSNLSQSQDAALRLSKNGEEEAEKLQMPQRRRSHAMRRRSVKAEEIIRVAFLEGSDSSSDGSKRSK